MGMAAKQAVTVSDKTVVPGTDTELDIGDLSAQIAAELAAQLIDAEGVCEKYGLSSAQWERLRRNPIFREMLREAVRTWRGELNAGQRITKKAEIVLEEALPILDTMIHDAKLHPDSRLNAIKQVESLTGRKAKEQGGPAGGLFNLTINIGKGKGVTLEGVAEPVSE